MVGNKRVKADSIRGVIHRHFTTLFARSQVNPEPVLEVVTPKVTSEMNSILLAPYMPEEFQREIFQMHPDKAPGLDGNNLGFYQRFWNLIGSVIFTSCVDWMQNLSMP